MTTIFSHLHDGPYVAHKCSKGLMNCAMPVMVKGEQVATLFMGQFLHEPPDDEFFRHQAQQLGVDEQAYLAALRPSSHHFGRAAARCHGGADPSGPNAGDDGVGA